MVLCCIVLSLGSFLLGTVLSGLQLGKLIFNLAVTGEIVEFLVDRRFPAGIDQLGLGLHLFNPALQFVKTGDGVAARAPADLFLGAFFAGGTFMPLDEDPFLLLGAVQLVFQFDDVFLVFLDQSAVFAQFAFKRFADVGKPPFFDKGLAGQIVAAFGNRQCGAIVPQLGLGVDFFQLSFNLFSGRR